jgi:putative nucleotidyltransferase with HDIG domain
MLKWYTQKLGYAVLGAENGRDAWELWQREKPKIVVTDWLMPFLDGLELCEKIRAADDAHYTYLIIISGQNAQQDVVQGLETGIDDYMVKPVSLAEYNARLKIGIRIVNLEAELTQRYDDIKKNYIQTIRMFTHLIEVFDENLGGHCRRVARLSLEMARRIPELGEADYELIETTALLHDIGMVGLPLEILGKSRTEMTGNENELYRSHPILGEIILNEIEILQPVAKLVRWHHEQYNGRGFPDGLSGADIPVPARLVSAASIYDNLVHLGKISLKDIPDHLQRMRGYQIDPDCVKMLLEINAEAILEEQKKSAFEIPIDDLEDGMKLAGDVRRKNGALVVPADTVINKYGIEKLKKHCELACISDKVLVHLDSVKG